MTRSPASWIDLVRPYRGRLAALAALNLLVAVIALALPWLAADLFGAALNGSGAAAGRTSLLLGAGLVLASFAGGLAGYLSARADAEITADLQQRTFDHAQRLPIAFHEGRGKGDVLALVMFEAVRLARFLSSTLVATPARLVTTIGAAILMLRVDPRLGLAVPLLIPVLFLIAKVVGRSLRFLALAHQQAEARSLEVAEEALEMLPATKAFNREESQSARMRAAVAEVAELKIRQARIHAIADPLVLLAAAGATVAVLVLAGQTLRTGAIGVAELLRLALYAALLVRPVNALAHLYGEYQTALGALTRFQSDLGEPIEGTGRVDSTRAICGAIHFEAIDFAFPGRTTLFRDLNLEIAPGERVALTGANGVGKTALVNLLLRFHHPTGGRILLDGVDIAELDLAALRSRIGLVPQVTYLFNGSIRDNIGFGVDDPPLEAIRRAAALAQAQDFITALPEGYETRIGDRGMRLSGGQRQRLALARALLKDPPVLVFDEATAMFDEAAEEAFAADCMTALEGRTVILITHRPAMLALASREVEIVAGQAREVAGGGLLRARA